MDFRSIQPIRILPTVAALWPKKMPGIPLGRRGASLNISRKDGSAVPQVSPARGSHDRRGCLGLLLLAVFLVWLW